MNFFSINRIGLSIIFLTVALSCDDEILPKSEDLDQDMIAATDLADEYLSSYKGRGNSERSITIFKYKDDQVYFNTNTDDINGYQILTEESITAVVDYGEYIFWYSGGGMTDLDGIEFDDVSEEFLNELPDEIKDDKMWVVKMPEKHELESNGTEVVLKYDILYQYKGYEGAPIRLDPKVRVVEGEDDDGGGDQ